MEVVLDIETDDLAAKQIHCIVAKEVKSGKVHEWSGEDCYKSFPVFTKEIETYIMHNGVSFDAPILNRLAGTNIRLDQIKDTLIMSQLANPIREGGHSLESWGKRFDFPKGNFNDFSKFTPEMLEYCRRDVDLTHRVYISLKKELEKFSKESLELEHKIRELIDEQEVNGFTLDVPKAMCLMNRFQDKETEIEKELQNIFPAVVEERYSQKTGKKLKDKVTIFNPGSRQQIAERLMAKGWQPVKKTEKGHTIVDESVLQEITGIPESKVIVEFLLLQKRVAQIKSWLEFAGKDNKVHGKVFTLGTISGRMSHNSPNMAQVPAVYSPYGVECRECWIPSEPDNVLVGCDASSLELRVLAHYLNDERFTKEVVGGDIHTANQNSAGLKTRDQAKTFIYAFIYGAGPAKIGSIIGGGWQEGKNLINKFLANVPVLKIFKERVDKVAESGYIRGLDGRGLVVRSAHAALNLLIQGGGAIICKHWLVEIDKLKKENNIRAGLVASIHDEYQFEVHKNDAERFGELTKSAMKNVERILKIKCPLASEYKVGLNWAKTH